MPNSSQRQHQETGRGMATPCVGHFQRPLCGGEMPVRRCCAPAVTRYSALSAPQIQFFPLCFLIFGPTFRAHTSAPCREGETPEGTRKSVDGQGAESAQLSGNRGCAAPADLRDSLQTGALKVPNSSQRQH